MNLISILLVEDNEADVILIKDAFEVSHLPHTLEVTRNGYEALQFLSKEGPYREKASPDLILLDINMPIMNGYEVLDFIKNSIEFKHLPVLMLTTSSAPKDILKSYQKYSNSYIIKPHNAGAFENIVESIKSFWMNVAALPHKGN